MYNMCVYIILTYIIYLYLSICFYSMYTFQGLLGVTKEPKVIGKKNPVTKLPT